MANGPLRASVKNGRLVLDEPTDLADGTVLELVPAVEVDEIDDEERERLHAAIRRGVEQGQRGESRPIDDALAEIRARR